LKFKQLAQTENQTVRQLQTKFYFIKRNISELENNSTLFAQNLFIVFRSELQQKILRQINYKIKNRQYILTLVQRYEEQHKQQKKN
jgi:hypothetical protein